MALRIYDDLARLGFHPWIDIRDLRGGQEWKPAILDALRHSSNCIAVISRNSVSKKGYVQRELREAIEILAEYPPDGIFLIPVRADGSKPRHERLRDLNWVDLFPDYEQGMGRILQALRYKNVRRQPNPVSSVDETSALLPLPTATTPEVVDVVATIENILNVCALRPTTDITFRQHAASAYVKVSRSGFEAIVQELLEAAIVWVEESAGSPWVDLDIRVIHLHVVLTVSIWAMPGTPEEVCGRMKRWRWGYRGYFSPASSAARDEGILDVVRAFAANEGGSVSIDGERISGRASELAVAKIRIDFPLVYNGDGLTAAGVRGLAAAE